jgi:hypothetical protein
MKKINQAMLNKILLSIVGVLALYSVLLTWWGVSAYFDAKRSLEFLYLNVEFRGPTK